MQNFPNSDLCKLACRHLFNIPAIRALSQSSSAAFEIFCIVCWQNPKTISIVYTIWCSRKFSHIPSVHKWIDSEKQAGNMGMVLQWYRLGTACLGSGSTYWEKALSTCINCKLSTEQQHVLGVETAQNGLRCTNRSAAERWREVTALQLALTRAYLEYHVQFWVPQYKKNRQTEASSVKGPCDSWGWSTSTARRLKEQGYLAQRGLQRDPPVRQVPTPTERSLRRKSHNPHNGTQQKDKEKNKQKKRTA